jgi:hypothetical protein
VTSEPSKMAGLLRFEPRHNVEIKTNLQSFI